MFWVSKQITFNANFAHTYFSAGKADKVKINLLQQKFWEVNNSGTESASSLNHEDKLALHMVEK